ncbi:MAG: hypothetical protein V4487_05350 [Chlamydiota bacterium]
MSGEYKEILQKLISFPLKSQIKIDFDLKKKTFHFSTPIFSSPTGIPQCIHEYVAARKNHVFKPHGTSFQFAGFGKVQLMQEISFSGIEPNLRRQVDSFWQMAKQCHKMMSEISMEEKFKSALYLVPNHKSFDV